MNTKKENRWNRVKKIIVENEEEGMRIDKFLAKIEEDLSRVAIQRLIEENKIQVNGKKPKASYKVCNGDIIEI